MDQRKKPIRNSEGTWRSDLAGIRWPQLTACALIASLILLGVYVLLNPLEDDPELMERLLREQRGEGTAEILSKSDGGTDAIEMSLSERNGSLNPTLRYPDPDAKLDAAGLQAFLGEVAKVLSLEMDNDSAALHVAAMIHAELKQTQVAEELWRKCLQKSPSDMGPVVGLAGLLVKQGKAEEGIEILERAKGSELATADFFEVLAEAHTKLGNLEAAEEAAKLGVRKFPDQPSLWFKLGVAETQLRKNGQAESSLRRAIDLGDRSTGTVNALMTVLNRVGKSEEAREMAKMAALSSGPSGEASQSAAEGQSPAEEGAQGDATFAESYAEILRSLAIPLLRNAASVAVANKSYAHAEKWLLQALAEDPTNPAIYMDFSSFLRANHRWGDAVILHQKLVALQPANILNYMNLASVATQAQQHGLADQALAAATERFPDVAYLYGERAKLALVDGNLESFKQMASKAYELEPMNVEWTLMLAVVAKQSGNQEEMKKLIHRAKELAPGDPRVPDFHFPTAP